jgi:hypothetical protein
LRPVVGDVEPPAPVLDGDVRLVGALRLRVDGRGELFARERRVGDGRFLCIREGGAHGRAAVTLAGLAAGVERGVVAVLRHDAADHEKERRVVVTQADEVEQQLGIVGTIWRL